MAVQRVYNLYTVSYLPIVAFPLLRLVHLNLIPLPLKVTGDSRSWGRLHPGGSIGYMSTEST